MAILNLSFGELNVKLGSSAFGTRLVNFGCSAGSLRPAARGTAPALRNKVGHGSAVPRPSARLVLRKLLLVVISFPFCQMCSCINTDDCPNGVTGRLAMLVKLHAQSPGTIEIKKMN